MGTIPPKILRIQDDEKELLFQLREIYASDYKKYSEHIKRESTVPISIKKIYKVLNEHKAYRRISDYFHRKRTTKNARPSKSNRSFHRLSTRGLMQAPKQIPVDNEQQQSTSPTMTDVSNEEQNYLSPVLNSTHQCVDPTRQSSKPDLLLIRESIQKALYELDKPIISKSDRISSEQQYRSLPTNNHHHSKLNDIIQSLSTVVQQQQENTRLIFNESSILLVDDDKRSITTQESIKNLLECLTTLIDRGHSIYDRIENILTEF